MSPRLPPGPRDRPCNRLPEGKLAGLFMAPMIRRETRKDLQKLKGILEGQQYWQNRGLFAKPDLEG